LAKARFPKSNGKDGILITVGSHQHVVKERPEKILDFLLAIHALALEKNAELAQAQENLQKLNEILEQKVQERALAMVAESSQRQETEEELARIRVYQALILNSIWEGVLGIDLAGRISFVNPAWGIYRRKCLANTLLSCASSPSWMGIRFLR
jgi:PAS domain-containing protein